MQVPESLQAFCRAFASKDADQTAALFDPKGVCELPLIGQRLVGRREIQIGFLRAFSVIDSCSILARSVRSSAGGTIAEGRLRAKVRRDPDPIEAALAAVLIEEAGRIARLSFYFDAAPFRSWCDGPIFG
jgi:ketosteroid isomerase-like protein